MAVTQQQIADVCGVSRGTVDRALRDRGGIKPEVAQRIKDTARQMGYIPRQAAPPIEQRPVRIGVILHTHTSAFVQKLENCMRDYPRQAMLPIDVVTRSMDDTNVSHQLALIDEMIGNNEIDGLVLMPLASSEIRDKINEVSEKYNIPVVTVNTDITDCNRLAYVGPNNLDCGRTAAALMAMSIGKKGKVLPILGQRSGHYVDTLRLNGFLSEMAEHYPEVEVLSPEYCYLDASMAERITRRALQNTEELSGIYLSTVGRKGVYTALQQTGNAGRVHVVVHDLVDENLNMVKKGVVDFAIGQGMEDQGSLSLKLLYLYIVKHIAPEKRENITEIDIKFRCNL